MKKGKQSKVHVHCRLELELYLMVRDVADVLFRDFEDSEGNFSAALNYLLKRVFEEDLLGRLVGLIRCKAEYDRGVRTQSVIDGNKQFESLLGRLLSSQ